MGLSPIRTLLKRWAFHMALVTTWVLPGCATTKFTDTPRTAFEQELMSQAIDAAVEPLPFESIAGSDVYLDMSRAGDRADLEYIEYVLRTTLAAQAVRLTEEPGQADFIVMLGVGSSGTNRYDSLLGLPATPLGSTTILPVAVSIPEIAVFKYVKQHGVCRVRISILDAESGVLVEEFDSGFATAEHTYRWLLGIGPYQRQRLYFR